MMITRLTIFTVVFAIFSSLVVADDPCRFQDPVKGILDLSSVGRTDGQPAYKDKLPAGSNYKYSYNPCKPFSEGMDCTNVAGCQVSLDGLYAFAIGRQETASWNPVPMPGASPTITYTSGEKKTIVTLVCSLEGRDEFEALGEDPQNTYKFRFTHKCACWNGCGGGPQPPTTTKSGGGGSGDDGGGGGIGGGSIFIILLLVLIFVYLVGFASFYRFHQQRSGVELIPHRTFWVGLPGYAKDGAVFLYQRVASKGGNSYNSV